MAGTDTSTGDHDFAGTFGAPAATSTARVSVTIKASVPAGTPAGDPLWITGNLPELGAWEPRGLQLRPYGGAYRARLDVPIGTQLEFKLTRGGWDTVEVAPSGEGIPNRSHWIDAPLELDVAVGAWIDRPRASSGRTWTGDVRHFGRVESWWLGNGRDVWVYLPPGYDRELHRRYPVVYFQDGQNVFDASTAFAGVEWGADETLERLIAAGTMRPVIAVAVANTPERMQEYSHVRDAARGGGGCADLYVKFLAKELKPRLDSEFRTLAGLAHTALVGSSLGGLVSLYGGIAAWERFGLVGALSPVLEWGDRDIEHRYEHAPMAQLPLKLWVDMGTREHGDDSIPIEELRRFRELLLRRGYVEGVSLTTLEVEDAIHDEAAWAARLPDVLRFLFPPE
jgi:predicted alpha/beta superfamily hydrolase